MIDNLLTTSFALELKAGVFLYIEHEKRFIYCHHVSIDSDSVKVMFAHTETDEGHVQADIFDIEHDAIVDYFQPCTINYN